MRYRVGEAVQLADAVDRYWAVRSGQAPAQPDQRLTPEAWTALGDALTFRPDRQPDQDGGDR